MTKGRLKTQKQVFRRPLNWISTRLGSNRRLFTAQQDNQCASRFLPSTVYTAAVRAALKWIAQYQKGRLKNRKQVFQTAF